jgi:hypothetical protein
MSCYAINKSIINDLCRYIKSPEYKKLGVQITQIICHLPSIYSDLIMLQNREKFLVGTMSFEIYKVLEFGKQKYKKSISGFTIYAVKVKMTPADEFRLYFTIDKKIKAVVYLAFFPRPYDDPNLLGWEMDIIKYLTNYKMTATTNISQKIWEWHGNDKL